MSGLLFGFGNNGEQGMHDPYPQGLTATGADLPRCRMGPSAPLGPLPGPRVFTLLLSAADSPASTPSHFFPGLPPSSHLRLLPQCNSHLKCPYPSPHPLTPFSSFLYLLITGHLAHFQPRVEFFLDPSYCKATFPSWEPTA